MKTVLKLFDYSDDPGKFSAEGAADLSAAMVTFLTGKTYCGCVEANNITRVVLGTPMIATGSDDLPFSDKDVKCTLTFKVIATGEIIRLSIPAPKTNIDAASIYSDKSHGDRREVPMLKPAGEVGIDGSGLAAQVETMLGLAEGALKFESGSFTKVAA